MFSHRVTEFWRLDASRSTGDDDLPVMVDPSLPPNRALSILISTAGPGVVSATPEIGDQLGLAGGSSIGREVLFRQVAGAGIALNDPDRLFYLPQQAQQELVATAVPASTRQLTPDDTDAFAELVAATPADDLDEAFVELDHWLVFGSFVGDRLAAVASMYPWRGSALADLGVVTRPDQRGHGFARTTVRAMSAHALSLGYEPQYRCQFDNSPSVSLAGAAGFVQFGDWWVIDADE